MVLVLGAAFGPHATGVEVRDGDTGALVATGHARHADSTAHPDDPTAWWRSLASAVAATGQREIAAISVCGAHPGLVLLDGAGAVLRPMQPWPEAEVAAEADRLRQALGPDTWARRIGALPGAGTAASRMAWLQRVDPDTFGRIGAALLPHDWLTYRLSGRAVTDRGSASLTGCWSPSQEDWSPEVLGRLARRRDVAAWRDALPDVLGPSDEADWLTAPVFELLGLRGRPLVAAGTGEPMAVALALEVGPGAVAVSLGARTTTLVGLDQPVADATGAVRSRADATGRHLAVVSMGGGAGAVRTVGSVLGLEVAEMAALAHATDPSLGDPLLVPDAGRGALLSGLAPGVGRGQVARAAFDGTAAAALDALDRATAAGARPASAEPVRLAAPDADVAVHAQAFADLTGVPVRAAPPGSMAAAGACIQAAAVLHRRAPLDVAASWRLGHGTVVEPVDDPDRAARWAAHRAARERATTS